MIGIIQEMLAYPFLVRALIVGVLVSLCASLLGVSLVLKQYSMIGDSLSHVSFGALSVAMAFGMAPLRLSLPVVSIVAVLLLRLKSSYMKSDAALAVISSGALGIGVIVTALTTGMTMDVCGYMFGSLLAMNKEDVFISIVLSVIVLAIFVLCYNRLFAVTFDENFAKASGVKVSGYNTLIAVLTAVTIVLGMRMMGAMLISSLIIFPALTSMRIFGNFKKVVIASAIISLICFILGIMGSYQYATPTGASVVAVYMVLFIAVILWRKCKKYVKTVAMFAIVTCVLVGCQSDTAQETTIESNTQGASEADDQQNKEVVNKEVFNIEEKLFLSQMTDIYTNSQDYIGRIISLEGYMFMDSPEADVVGGVVRNTPGCCGDDGMTGFLYTWSGAKPKENEWIRVTGVLTERESDDASPYFVLEASEVKVLEVRGEEFVTQ